MGLRLPGVSLPDSGIKVALPPDTWLNEDTIGAHFQAQISAEVAAGEGGIREDFSVGVGGNVLDVRAKGT